MYRNFNKVCIRIQLFRLSDVIFNVRIQIYLTILFRLAYSMPFFHTIPWSISMFTSFSTAIKIKYLWEFVNQHFLSSAFSRNINGWYDFYYKNIENEIIKEIFYYLLHHRYSKCNRNKKKNQQTDIFHICCTFNVELNALHRWCFYVWEIFPLFHSFMEQHWCVSVIPLLAFRSSSFYRNAVGAFD